MGGQLWLTGGWSLAWFRPPGVSSCFTPKSPPGASRRDSVLGTQEGHRSGELDTGQDQPELEVAAESEQGWESGLSGFALDFSRLPKP